MRRDPRGRTAFAPALLAVLVLLSPASAQAQTRWYLPQGATGPAFEEFILLANSTSTPANVRLTFAQWLRKPGDAGHNCPSDQPNSLPFGEYLIGVSERVQLRSQPSADADVITEARYPVLVDCGTPASPCGPETAGDINGWQRVRLDALVGYVSRDQLGDQE